MSPNSTSFLNWSLRYARSEGGIRFCDAKGTIVATVTRSRKVTCRGKTSTGSAGFVSWGSGKGADPEAR